MKVPPPLPQWMALVVPFQLEVWLAFIFTVIATLMFFISYAIFYPNAEMKTKDVWMYIWSLILDESYRNFTRMRYDIF